MNARYYAAAINRFLTADTLVPGPNRPQAFNRYSYVLGNPLRLLDPSGHGDCNVEPGGNCQNNPPVPPAGPGRETPEECVIKPEKCGYQSGGYAMEHEGSNNTVTPGFALSDDDLLLLTLAVFVETQNGTHPSETMILKAWTYINKIGLHPGDSVFSTLNYGTTNTWVTDRNFVVALERRLGPLPADDQGRVSWLLNAANNYMNGSDPISENFQALHKMIAGPGGVYETWRSYGSNSFADPSHGAIYAVEREAGKLENLAITLEAHAQNNSDFSYVISQPFRNGELITVVGNGECIYDQTLCN